MPRTVEITCDVCGKNATAYPSFFELRNVNEGYVQAVPGHSMLVQPAPVERKVSTRGCLSYDLRLYLCAEHFKSLNEACATWFESVPDSMTDLGEG